MSNRNVVVFDFDGTLYQGNSFHDFLKFLTRVYFLKFHWISLFTMLLFIFLRGLKLISHQHMKERIVLSAQTLLDAHQLNRFVVQMLANLNQTVYQRLQKNLQDDSVITLISSAAPCVYMHALAEHLKVNKVHCSYRHDGYWLENIREQKLIMFSNEFQDVNISELYTDHHDDLVLAKLAKQTFLVKPKGKSLKVYKEEGIKFQALS